MGIKWIRNEHMHSGAHVIVKMGRNIQKHSGKRNTRNYSRVDGSSGCGVGGGGGGGGGAGEGVLD